MYRRHLRIRRLVLLLTGVALLATLVAAGTAPTVNARQQSGVQPIFGTLIAAQNDEISLATAEGLVTLNLAAETRVQMGRDRGDLNDLFDGARIAATASEGTGGELTAQSILIRPQEGPSRHVVGVVTAYEDGVASILDSKERVVTIDVPAELGPLEEGAALTLVAQRDRLSDRLVAQAVKRADETVERLQDAVARAGEKRIPPGQLKKLRRLIDENSTRHLKALQKALDRVGQGVAARLQLAAAKIEEKYRDIAASAGARGPARSVEGAIVSVGADSVTISTSGGRESTYRVTSETEIEMGGEAALTTQDALAASKGLRVEVEFTSSNGEGPPVARKVEIEADAPSEAAFAALELSEGRQFVGVIIRADALSDLDDAQGILRVTEPDGDGEVIFKVASTAEITLDGRTATLEELSAGLRVSAALNDGRTRAERIRAWTPEGDERRVRGVVTEVDTEERTLAVRVRKGPSEMGRIFVTDATTIEREGVPVTLSEVRPHDLMLGGTRVRAETGEALFLQLQSPKIRDRGTVAGVAPGANELTLDPEDGDLITVTVNESTAFPRQGNFRRSLATVQAGDKVIEVEYQVDPDSGKNLALSLKVQANPVRVVGGRVTGVDAGGSEVMIRDEKGVLRSLQIDSGKISVKKDGRRLSSLEEIRPGDVVERAIIHSRSGSLKKLDLVTAQSHFVRGRIKEVAPASNEIELTSANGRDLKLQVTDASVLRRNGEIAEFRAFRQGDVVLEALYAADAEDGIDADGRLVRLSAAPRKEQARGREQDRPSPAQTSAVQNFFTGRIEKIKEEIWEVSDRELRISADTVISGEPREGAIVRISAALNSDQVYVAEEVRVLAYPGGPDRPRQDESGRQDGSDQGRAPKGDRFEITGTVTGLDGRTVSVAERTFTLTSDTKLEGELTVGVQVEARLLMSPNGELTALKVEVVESDRPASPTPETATPEPSSPKGTRITGTISAIKGNFWTVDGQRVKIADEAVILGIPKVGAEVSLVARRQRSNAFLIADGRIQVGSGDQMATVVPTQPVPTAVSPTAPAPTAEPSDSGDGDSPSNEYQQTPEKGTVTPEPGFQY